MGIKRSEIEASNDSRSREQELDLMDSPLVLIDRDDSATASAKLKDVCFFVMFVLDRISTPVVEKCIKATRQGEVNRVADSHVGALSGHAAPDTHH